MPLDRTWYNTLVDDDGSNTVGSLWNKASVDHVYDDVDAALAGVAPIVPGLVTISNGGSNVFDVVLPTALPYYYVKVNATAADITLKTATAGAQGSLVLIRNTGTFTVWVQHLGTGAGAPFQNLVTSGLTPLAKGGAALYVLDFTVGTWSLVSHQQGSWITPAYSAAHWVGVGATWTVDAGDVLADRYRISGRTLEWQIAIANSSVSAAASALIRTLYGYTVPARGDALGFASDAGAAAGMCQVYIPAGTQLQFLKVGGNWSTASNSTLILSQGFVEIT